MGMEEAEKHPTDLRVTLQFHIGETLSDYFFNAVTGYRGKFRRGWQCGLRYNRILIEGVGAILAECNKAKFAARVAGLVPDLSKVWFCGRLIGADGRVTALAFGVTARRELRLNDNMCWASIWRAEQDALWSTYGVKMAPAEEREMR